MYRNCIYNSRSKSIILYTWDKDGNRIEEEHPVSPYYYLETYDKSKFDAISLFGSPLKIKKFDTQYERYESLKDSYNDRVFYNLRVEQQFLIDHFAHRPEFQNKMEFSKRPLKVFFLDIEVHADTFPVANEAKYPINIITVYDSISGKYYTWGLGKYIGDDLGSIYVECSNEKELLKKFLKFWVSGYPDVLSCWNSTFDVNYIVNRLKNIFNQKAANILSPVGSVYSRLRLNKFQQQEEYWVLKGVSSIDYIELYKKFTPNQKPSYKLDNIAEEELGIKKIEYEGSLYQLAIEDWKTFTEYNVHDVRLMVGLEDKLQFMKILRMIAYIGLCGLEGALGTVQVVDGALAIKAKGKGKIIPTFNLGEKQGYAGGFVRVPVSGLYDSVVSFDLNSLYPNIIITLNSSPETKVGKVISREDGDVKIQLLNGSTYDLTEEKFDAFMKTKELALSKFNVLFSQSEKGIIPELVDENYKDRVKIRQRLKEVKSKMTELDKRSKEYKDLKREAEQLHIMQYQIKILINSVYGYLGNRFAALCDYDIASSVTLTGQEVIKNSYDWAEKYDFEGVKAEGIYGDTDSIYLTINNLQKVKNIPLVNSDGDINDVYFRMSDFIEKKLNQDLMAWGKSDLYSKDCRFEFKREAISSTGLFLNTKKRYALRVLDDEGVKADKIKITGIEIVSSSTPALLKPALKNIVKVLLETKSVERVNVEYKAAYEVFTSLRPHQVSGIKTMSDLDKYTSLCNTFQTCKGMPIHCKAAYYYNLLLDILGLENKYPKFKNGDKVSFFYVTENPYGISTIGFKDKYPKEFDSIFNMDSALMFKKVVAKLVERIYHPIGWNPPDVSQKVLTDLEDLFG